MVINWCLRVTNDCLTWLCEHKQQIIEEVLAQIGLDIVVCDARSLVAQWIGGMTWDPEGQGSSPVSASNFLAENNHNHVCYIHAFLRGFNVRRFREVSRNQRLFANFCMSEEIKAVENKIVKTQKNKTKQNILYYLETTIIGWKISLRQRDLNPEPCKHQARTITLWPTGWCFRSL